MASPDPHTYIMLGRRAAEDAARRAQLQTVAAAKKRELATSPLLRDPQRRS